MLTFLPSSPTIHHVTHSCSVQSHSLPLFQTSLWVLIGRVHTYWCPYPLLYLYQCYYLPIMLCCDLTVERNEIYIYIYTYELYISYYTTLLYSSYRPIFIMYTGYFHQFLCTILVSNHIRRKTWGIKVNHSQYVSHLFNEKLHCWTCHSFLYKWKYLVFLIPLMSSLDKTRKETIFMIKQYQPL